MNTKNLRKAGVAWLAVALLSPTLTACGTLEVSVERTPMPTPLPTPMPIPGLTPTRPPVLYRPTGRPTDVSSLVDCTPRADTDEACLDNGQVRLVGYLGMPSDGSQDYFTLSRGTERTSVMVTPAEGHSTDMLRWLLDHNALALVEGWVTSLDPPTLLTSREQPAARSFHRSVPLAEVYTNPKLGIAIGIPAGWIVEDHTGKGMGGTVAIRNHHSRDVGWPPIDRPDPSLYCVEIVPILRTQATTIAQMRAQIESRVLREQSMTINDSDAIRLGADAPIGGRTEILLVQRPDGVLLLQTWQDPALFERMIETLLLAFRP